MRAHLLVALLAAGCNSGDSKVPHDDDADAAVTCMQGASPTLEVTGPDTYACHDPYKAKLTLTNRGCQTLTVSKVSISATVLSSTGNCSPPGKSTYDAVVTSIAPGKTAVVQDITGGAYCCFQQACPSNFTCDQKYDFTVETSAGTVTDTLSPVHVNLQSCDVICGQ